MEIDEETFGYPSCLTWTKQVRRTILIIILESVCAEMTEENEVLLIEKC